MTTTLITGGNRGLGFEVARQLVAAGHAVWIGARDEARGQEAADAVGARFVQLDVTNDESVANLPVATSTSLLYLVPAGAVLIAFLWLGETAHATELLGGIVVIAGVVLVRQGDRLQRPRRRPDGQPRLPSCEHLGSRGGANASGAGPNADKKPERHLACAFQAAQIRPAPRQGEKGDTVTSRTARTNPFGATHSHWPTSG